MWVQIPPGAAHFFFERRESEPSQLALLCCLALFIVSRLFNCVGILNVLHSLLFYVVLYVHTLVESFVAGKKYN